jgi:hypothetical protein
VHTSILSTRTIRSAVTAAAAIVLAGGLVAAAAAPASAADAGTGWVRVGHFSPNTKAVDVKITALAGGAALYSLDDVTYGQVSKYLDMNAGNYVVSMRPATASASSKPMISQSFQVQPGIATTVAAYGSNAHLKTTVFTDNLTAPAAGDARIRLIQASTKHPTVTLTTSTGMLLAKDASTGTATDYASVPAGPWTLDVTGSGAKAHAPVNLANGTVDTVLVLDNASGGVSLSTIVDSSSVGAQPSGGVQTGGGYLAQHGADTSLTPKVRSESR